MPKAVTSWKAWLGDRVAWGQSAPVALLQPRLAADAAPHLSPAKWVGWKPTERRRRRGHTAKFQFSSDHLECVYSLWTACSMRTQPRLVLPALLVTPLLVPAPPPGPSPPWLVSLVTHTQDDFIPSQGCDHHPPIVCTPNFTPGAVPAWTSVPRHVARPRT